MNRIKVKIPEHEYEVVLGDDIIYDLKNEIQHLDLSSRVFAIIDENLFKLHRSKISEALSKFKIEPKYVIIEAKEENKSLEMLQYIFEKLLYYQCGRDAVILAIGGGIIGDLAGYAAASYMRGLPYVQVPTTLLAAVDSSVGGKTGVNFMQRKNIIGAFHQPELVLADTKLLKTLNKEEILCGLGEIIKYGYLSNEDFYQKIKNNVDNILALESKVLSEIISESVKIKAGVVRQDEKESGLRKILNLGHTFSHAIESEQNYSIKHGTAVIVGISAALYLSENLNLISTEKLNSLLELINKVKPHINLSKMEGEKLYEIMFNDKKNREGKIKFVLVKDIGEVLIDVEADKESVINAIEKAERLFL
jgi:3-dehydroquinate synthase